MRNPFILQTSEDYDIPYYIVESIYENDRENLYERLEEILNEKK